MTTMSYVERDEKRDLGVAIMQGEGVFSKLISKLQPIRG
jgi:hypothetical protein